jgi:hypothetical protein
MLAYKKENTELIGADGSELGEGRMKFTELNGVMKNLLGALQARRSAHVSSEGKDSPFETLTLTVMDEWMVHCFDLSAGRMNPSIPVQKQQPFRGIRNRRLGKRD